MIDLYPEWQVGDLRLTDYPYSVDRDSTVDIGEPGFDGDDGERTYSLTVYVEGADLAEVATNEAALRREIRRTGLTLTHEPGDDFSPTSVYDVLDARMKVERSDVHESHLIRKVALTLACSPFARSLDSVIVPALSVGATPSTVTVDEVTSTTGWSGSSPTFDATYGAVRVTGSAVTLARAAAVDVSAHPYLVLDWQVVNPTGLASVQTFAGATGLTEAARVAVLEYGGSVPWYRSWFPVTAGQLDSGFYMQANGATSLAIAKVQKSNTPPGVTPRQLTRTIAVGGTERTPGSIHVKSANGTDDLAHTIVHTCPEDSSGYSPPLRRWRVSGNAVTSEAARFSGAYEQAEPSAFIAQVPNASLPAGDYLLVARLYSTGAATVMVNWAAGTIVNSQAQGQEIGSEAVAFAAAGWRTFALAVLSLPTVRSLGPVTQIDIQTSGADAVTTSIDEAWLFRMDEDCALTIVDNPAANLWLDSPDTTSSVPRVWIGDIADRSDARHPAAGLLGFGSHVLSPGGTRVFTAAETDYPATSGEFYHRWHSNAAD